MKCSNCGMSHSPSLNELLGCEVVPVTRSELANQLAKDSLEYTVRHWAGGKAICLFDVRLGRLWQAAANGWRQGRKPLLGGLVLAASVTHSATKKAAR